MASDDTAAVLLSGQHIDDLVRSSMIEVIKQQRELLLIAQLTNDKALRASVSKMLLTTLNEAAGLGMLDPPPQE